MEACEALDLKAALAARLREERAFDLAEKIEWCGEEISITCTNCGQAHPVPRRCKRKWCPACLRFISGRRSARVRGAVAEMRWPLFLTLTQPNSDDPEQVRHLRRSFGKLRHRKLWTSRTTGGVAAIEVTNAGRGWHPHLHAVIDCEWLAYRTPPPEFHRGSAHVAARCRAAQEELTGIWRSCLKVPEAIVHVKRCRAATITEEIVKYSVKGSDLMNSPDPIAPMIRVLEATRLVTTFGTFFGRGREFDDEANNQKTACESCGSEGDFIPTDALKYIWR